MIQDPSYTACAASDSSAAQLTTLRQTHRALLAARAKQFAQAPFSKAEMFNEALFALWRASEKFQGSPLEERAKFNAYADRCICNHLSKIKRRYFRKEIAAKALEVSNEAAVWDLDTETDMNRLTAEGLGIKTATEHSPAEDAQNVEIYARLNVAISKLNQKQQAVIVQRFYYGRSLDEAGQCVGLSARSASVYEHRALETLRRQLPAEFAQHFHQGSN